MLMIQEFHAEEILVSLAGNENPLGNGQSSVRHRNVVRSATNCRPLLF